ncbi:MAG: hypothetical protein ACRCYY_12690 [Trueperaceae bacterium]
MPQDFTNHNATATLNRERYDLLLERRRALLELDKLTTRITTHPRWDETLKQDSEIAAALKGHIDLLECALCSKACQLKNQMLLCEVQRIYKSLVVLSRVWVGLETSIFIDKMLLFEA